MNVQSISLSAALTAAAFTSTSILADFGTDQGQPLDREINAVLNLESSWHTTLRIDDTPGERISVQIPIGENTYTLDLEPKSVRSEEYKVLMQDDNGNLYEVLPASMRTLRGSITEMSGSIASGSLMEDGLYARIRLGNGEEVWMEPISDRVNGSPEDLYAFYFTHDVMESDGICGTVDNGSHFNVDDILKMLANYETNVNQRGNIICTAQIAFDADYEYYQDYGSVQSVEDRINQVINSINIQYEGEVSLSFEITTIIVRNTSNDPYTTSNCSDLLEQFANEWQSNHGGISRDVAHLFTGRNLADCVGIAFTPGVCQSWAYSLAQSDYGNNYSYTTQVSAHELGHGFSASHQETPYYNTMYPSINGGNTFNSNSVAEIISYSNQVNCLSCENQAPQGACCIGDNCVLMYQAQCDGGGGLWQGNNTTCDVNPCVAATGACCVDNACQTLSSEDCFLAGGSYSGDNVSCGSVSCAPGACCIDQSCSETLESDCSGNWYGEGSSCVDITCGAGADHINYEMRTWSSSDGRSMVTFDLYFPSTDPNTVMTAVFGNENVLELSTWSNDLFDGSATPVALHQSELGADVAHDRAWDALGGNDLVYDSYVAIGSDDAAFSAALLLGFDSVGFNNATGLVINDGLWFIIPDDPAGTIGQGTELGHRIGSFSIEQGQGFEALVNVQWNDGAGVVHQSLGLYWNNEGIAPACSTDINGDNATDVNDLLALIDAWGACSGCNADIDGSGAVDVDDLLLLIGGWGPC
ncbi:MAG: M12 family metallo-peptidase [Phycisphaerales bacterium]|nr:M12 family metallo-peptidase [Phycisphaerales bacterium]